MWSIFRMIMPGKENMSLAVAYFQRNPLRAIWFIVVPLFITSLMEAYAWHVSSDNSYFVNLAIAFFPSLFVYGFIGFAFASMLKIRGKLPADETIWKPWRLWMAEAYSIWAALLASIVVMAVAILTHKAIGAGSAGIVGIVTFLLVAKKLYAEAGVTRIVGMISLPFIVLAVAGIALAIIMGRWVNPQQPVPQKQASFDLQKIEYEVYLVRSHEENQLFRVQHHAVKLPTGVCHVFILLGPSGNVLHRQVTQCSNSMNAVTLEKELNQAITNGQPYSIVGKINGTINGEINIPNPVPVWNQPSIH